MRWFMVFLVFMSMAAARPADALPLPEALPSDPKGDVVAINFAPGDAPVRYTFETENEKNQRGVFSRYAVKSVDEVRFTPADTGGLFSVDWRTVEFRVEAPAPLNLMLESTYQALAAVPLTYQASRNGVPMALDDLSAMRTAIAESFKTLRATVVTPDFFVKLGNPKPGKAEVKAFGQLFDAALEPFLNVEDTALSEQLLETPIMMFGLGGASLAMRQPIPVSGVVSAPWGTPLRVSGTVEATYFDRPKNQLTIVTAASVDPESLKAAVEQYFESLKDKLPPEAVDQAKAQVDQFLKLKVTERAELVLDVATGIPDRLSYEKTTEINGETQTERRTVRRQ